MYKIAHYWINPEYLMFASDHSDGDIVVLHFFNDRPVSFRGAKRQAVLRLLTLLEYPMPPGFESESQTP